MTARPHASAVTFCGTDLLLYGAGYLYLPDHKMLVVSDLHLERVLLSHLVFPCLLMILTIQCAGLKVLVRAYLRKPAYFLVIAFIMRQQPSDCRNGFRINYQPLQPSVSSSGSPETMIRTSLRFCLVKAVIAISVTGWFSAMR